MIPTCHGTLGKADPGCAEGAVKVLRFTPSPGSPFLRRISTSLGPFWVIFVSICPALINYDRASPPNGLRGAALVTFLKTRCGSGDFRATRCWLFIISGGRQPATREMDLAYQTSPAWYFIHTPSPGRWLGISMAGFLSRSRPHGASDF